MNATTSPASGPARVPGAGVSVPKALRVGDGRGLTATGAVAVALGAGLAGGTIDVLSGVGLRTVFAVCFVLGCAIAAYKVHREDLLAAVVIPPLVYTALVAGSALFRGGPGGDSLLTQQALELFTELVLGAGTLLLATGAAATIAVLRLLLARRAR